MAASAGLITGTVSLRLSGADEPHAIATFELPLSVTVDRVGDRSVEMTATVSADGILRDVAAELRRLADHWDPEAESPTVDLPQPDLEPGFVIIGCRDCDSTMIGRPGDEMMHTGPDEHVYATTYGGGA
jgi:hypothetical protein